MDILYNYIIIYIIIYNYIYNYILYVYVITPLQGIYLIYKPEAQGCSTRARVYKSDISRSQGCYNEFISCLDNGYKNC